MHTRGESRGRRRGKQVRCPNGAMMMMLMWWGGGGSGFLALPDALTLSVCDSPMVYICIYVYNGVHNV